MRSFSVRHLTLAAAVVPLALATSAALAGAQWSTVRNDDRNRSYRSAALFEWSGRVDKEVRIIMRDGRATVDLVGNKETSRGRVRTLGTVPRIDGGVIVETKDGRGRVDVIQQPNARNNYTTIIRVRDPQSGQDNYRIRAYTTNPTRNGRNNDRYDHRGRGKDQHDRDYDRDHRDRRDQDKKNDKAWPWQ